jgi:hypothetical protein
MKGKTILRESDQMLYRSDINSVQFLDLVSMLSSSAQVMRECMATLPFAFIPMSSIPVYTWSENSSVER